MKRITLIRSLVVLFLLFPAMLQSANPQTSTYMVGNEKKYISWDQLDKTLVEVEGLAWGAADKGLGEHLILTQNELVYLTNINLLNTDLEGRLLNVVGFFRKQRMEKAPPGAQGYGQSFDYYTIEVIAARKIEKVVQYQILPPRNEWIVPGMPVTAALQKTRARNFPAYPMTIKGQENYTPLSFRVSEHSVLYLGEAQGVITSVSEYRPANTGKEWNIIRGYDVSTLKAAEIPIPPPKKDQLPIPPGGSFR